MACILVENYNKVTFKDMWSLKAVNMCSFYTEKQLKMLKKKKENVLLQIKIKHIT